MIQFMLSFLTTSLIMSLIILGAFSASFLFPNKFLPKLRYAIWAIIVVGLVVPMRPIIGDGLVTVEILPADVTLDYVQFVGGLQPPTGFVPSSPISTPAGYLNVAQITPIPVLYAFAVIWIVVVMGILAYHIQRYFQFIRIVKRWGVTIEDEAILSAFRTVQVQKGLENDRITLKKCNFISTSMLLGFFNPVILLPNKNFETDELELIFHHELIHYKRRDLYLKLLAVVATSLHWFNPMVYLMSNAMQADCEASCDEIVLSDVGRHNRQFYAELIMEMTGAKSPKGTLLSTCFYGSERGIKLRMEAIMNESGNVKKLTFSALLAVFFALTIFSGSVFAFSSTHNPDNFGLPESELYRPSSEDHLLSAVQARDIALETIGGGTFLGLFYDNHLDIYRIEILYGNTRYYLAIDAITGNAMVYRMEEILENIINWAQAVEIALSHTGGGAISSGSMEIIGTQTVFMFNIIAENRHYDVMIGGLGELLLLESILE